MRVLALHGHGTSAEILRRQLAPLTKSVFADAEFVFLQGEYECNRAPGISSFWSGPFFGYTEKYSPDGIRAVHYTIESCIEDQGPFDGVVGFSQGASMALSYLVQCAIDKPHIDAPFKFAVFFSTVAALSPDEAYCQRILDALTSEERIALLGFPHCGFETFSTNTAIFCASLAQAVISARTAGALDSAAENCFMNTKDAQIPRVMHPSFIHERVKIPTVHVSGRRESPLMLQIAALMRSLCDSQLVKAITHSGAHDLPTQSRDVQAVGSAIEWAAEQVHASFPWKAHM